MSKRNFILLIIILVIVVLAVFGFLYFNGQKNPSSNNGGGGNNFISQFNPFGNNTTTPPTSNNTPGNSGAGENTPPEATAKLVKVSSMPVAGFTSFQKERLIEVPATTPAPTTPTDTTTKPTPPATEFATALRYVDRATGNIYETFADKIEERKFSGTVIPQIHEALFGNKGDIVIMRYLKGITIETFVGNLPKEVLGGDTTGNNEVTGSFLPENITDVSLSSDAKSLFYIFSSGDKTIGTTLNLSTNQKVQIFSSPFGEWLSFWPNGKLVTLTTKPAAGIPGYMFGVDTGTKNFSEIFGGINGLTTLGSPDGKAVLYSDDTLLLNLYNTSTKISTALGLKTLPEKCVWGASGATVYCAVPQVIPQGTYPDSWYTGEVSFSDQIWKIDVGAGTTTLLLDPLSVAGGENIDGIKLSLDETENYLFFVNKKDSYLWEFNLK